MSQPQRTNAESVPILHARAAAVTSQRHGQFPDFSLRLDPGGLALIRLREPRISSLLADAACGLTDIAAGTLSFLGRDWRQPSLNEAAWLRGRIGRVFGGANWIGYLPVAESMILAHRYHRRGARDELLEQAGELCREFQLPGVPVDRPNALGRADLMRASCARAFLGSPRLVILEQPMRDLPADMLGPLVSAVGRARRQGGAVIWFASERAVWSHPALLAGQRYSAVGGRLTVVEES